MGFCFSKNKYFSGIFLGTEKSGKTTIFKRLAKEEIDPNEIDIFHAKTCFFENPSITLKLYDLPSGNDTWRHFIQSKDFVIFVMDNTLFDKDEIIKKKLNCLITDYYQEDELNILFVINNKDDILFKVDFDKITEEFKLSELKENIKWDLMECNGLKNENVLGIVDWVYKNLS